MKYLIDTNVISELSRKSPNKGVVDWIQSVSESQLYLSSITLAELRKGIDGIQCNKKKQHELNVWLDALKERFYGRILVINEDVAEAWGSICASIEKTPSAIDSLIAATAIYNHCTLVTRNTKDFKWFDISIINPW